MEKTEIIEELTKLAVRVNDETDYCVFVRLSGHVDWFGVEVKRSKQAFNEELATFEFRKWGEKCVFDEFESCRQILNRALAREKVYGGE